VVSAYLFGSHAEDRAHRESDVDVGVLLDRRALPSVRDRFETALCLSALLQEALGTRQVDLVVLNDAPPGLGRRVVRRGRRLVCSDEEADHAFVRDVQLPAADLEPFLREAERHGRVRGIVFVPAAPGPWLDRVAFVVAGRRRMLDVVVGTDGVALASPSWLRRLVWRGRPARALARADLDETIHRLLRAGVEPIVVERHTGKVYGLGHLRAMRA